MPLLTRPKTGPRPRCPKCNGKDLTITSRYDTFGRHKGWWVDCSSSRPIDPEATACDWGASVNRSVVVQAAVRGGK